MDVALALFAEHGYDGTSTRLIAAEAGVTEGLIFKYFPTKRDLLRAVIERYAPCAERAECEPEIQHAPIETALEMIFTHMADYLWENRSFIRMVIMESYRQGEAFQELVTLMEHGPVFLRRLLDERVASGEIALPDTAAAAEMLGGSVFAFFQRHQHRGEEEWRRRSSRFIHEIIQLFLSSATIRC
jgi:AcrR family transcriptional regulator